MCMFILIGHVGPRQMSTWDLHLSDSGWGRSNFTFVWGAFHLPMETLANDLGLSAFAARKERMGVQANPYHHSLLSVTEGRGLLVRIGPIHPPFPHRLDRLGGGGGRVQGGARLRCVKTWRGCWGTKYADRDGPCAMPKNFCTP